MVIRGIAGILLVIIAVIILVASFRTDAIAPKPPGYHASREAAPDSPSSPTRHASEVTTS